MSDPPEVELVTPEERSFDVGRFLSLLVVSVYVAGFWAAVLAYFSFSRNLPISTAALSCLVLLLTTLCMVVINRTCRRLPHFFELFVTLVILAVLAAILVPNFVRARARGQLTACKSNLKNIGRALEIYATDNAGSYPRQLAHLTPNYLKTIPTCPRAGQDRYSNGYRAHWEPDRYTFYCGGTNHRDAGVDGNYPQYTSVEGLLERP